MCREGVAQGGSSGVTQERSRRREIGGKYEEESPGVEEREREREGRAGGTGRA